jgi:hypothetical protein
MTSNPAVKRDCAKARSPLLLRWAYMNIRLPIISLLTIGSMFLVDSALAIEPVNSLVITEANWEHHPRIVEVRNIYNEIQSRIKSKQLKYQKKDYTVLPRSCRGTYPIDYWSVVVDSNGHVLIDVTAQRISHDDLLTTENYFDNKGHLRFVYITNKSIGMATIENRVYLDEQGKVIWDARTEAGKVTFGEITNDPWMIKETTNDGIFSSFKKEKVKCEQ